MTTCAILELLRSYSGTIILELPKKALASFMGRIVITWTLGQLIDELSCELFKETSKDSFLFYFNRHVFSVLLNN